MKKNYVAKLGALALAVSLITTGMMGTTLARYADESVATGTVAIAKWNVTLDNSQTETFNLADTKDTMFNANNVNSGTVAPGDRGKLELSIVDAGTDVAYKYSVKLDTTNFTGDNKPNIKFYSDADCKIAWADTVDEEVALATGGKTAATTTDKTIYWKWDEDNSAPNNTKDTNVGANYADDLTFTVTLSAEQIIEESTAPTS